jgi:AbrB family looped-hinge helix DNA binding protein
MTTTITSKGQITLPKKIRKQYGLNKGDRVEFLVDKFGGIKLIPCKSSIKKLKGMIPKPKKPISIDKMNKAIEQSAVDK